MDTVFNGCIEAKGWYAQEKQNRKEQDQNTLKLLFEVSFKLFSVITEPAVHCY